MVLALALIFSGGAYAYTYTTSTGTIATAEPTGDIATVATAANQPNWSSVLPQSGTGTEILRPNADGDETDITDQFPASGEHWDKVDDTTPDSDSTYVFSSANNWKKDLYNITDHTASSDTINYVRVYMVCRAAANPTQTSASVHIKTGGTEDTGNNETVTTSYASYSYQWDTNPQTGNAWTWDEIDALQIGVGLRKAANGVNTGCTQVYAEVSYEIEPVTEGEVPSGDLFVITPHPNYSGDLLVKVYLTNTSALVKSYQYLNMKLFLQGAAEAPGYRLLTLENGVATFNLEGCSGGSRTLSVIGGSYCLVSDDSSQWGAGWSVTPELHCEVTQR